MLKAFYDSELIGVIIFYEEEVLYINKGAKNITGYIDENISIRDLFSDDLISKFESNKSFSKRYVLIRTKSGSRKFIRMDYRKTEYNNSPANLIVFIDITNEIYLKNFYSISINIIDLIYNVKDINKFFEKLCTIFVIKKYVELAFIQKIEECDLIPITCKSQESITQDMMDIISKNNKSIIKSLLRGEIIVKENLKLRDKDGREIKYFSSSCHIPFRYKSEYKYVLHMYSKEPKFFKKFFLSVLKDLQQSISCFLEFIDELRFKNILFKGIENTHDWVVITDKNGVIEYANKAVEIISGYKREELLGKTPAVFSSGLYDKEFYKDMWDTILSGKVYKNKIINKRKDGTFFEVYHTIIPIYEDNKIYKFISIAKDITKEILLERQIERLINYDVLTGLYNRHGFINRVREEISNNKRKNVINTVFVIDIVGFSKLIEMYGINLCDNILITVSKILKSAIPVHTVIGRIGGDNFVMFFSVEKMEHVFIFLDYILDLFDKPIKEETIGEVKIDVKIGVITFPSHELDIEDKLSKAEIALNIVKKETDTNFKFYNEALQKDIKEYMEIVELIDDALKNKWFIFVLHPIYRVSSMEIAGFEALVRIRHPEKGIIPPIKFIDILETSSFLKEFEIYMFDTIVDYIKKIKDVYMRDFTVSVNISVNSFKTGSILDVIQTIPVEFIKHVNIEITERVFAENLDDILRVIKNIKSKGLKVEIDDFGTGYSSFGYIDKLPVDSLKIDKSFVDRITTSNKTYHIVKSIIDIAKAVGFSTIAEGVETKEEFELLKKFGCDYVQGYYFSKPMMLEDVLRNL